MDIADLSISLAASRVASQGSILVARKSLDMLKQQGENAVALIRTAAPPVEAGNGKLVNVLA